MDRLVGKVAIVAAGAAGIGGATSRRLVAEGARVAIGDVDLEGAQRLADELGENAIAVQFDAVDPSSIERMVVTTVQKFGRLDILHNNAAIRALELQAGDTNPVDIDLDLWDHFFAVNVRSHLAGCKYAIPHMLEAGGGSIIITASQAGRAGTVDNIAYGSTKAALIGMTRYIATIYGKQGIRCNAICPGLIVTESMKIRMTQSALSIIERSTLTPRLGTPDDIAATVVYLASDDSAFVTGVALAVDGGLMAHTPMYADLIAPQPSVGGSS